MIYNIQLINKITNQPVNWYINAPNVFEAIGKAGKIIVSPTTMI